VSFPAETLAQIKDATFPPSTLANWKFKESWLAELVSDLSKFPTYNQSQWRRKKVRTKDVPGDQP
jgi:hypothetical protein